MKKAFLLLSVVAAIVTLNQSSFCQALYSYVDESGIRVFSNIAPTSPVFDLKIIGEVPAEASAPASEPSDNKSASYDDIIEKYANNYHLDPTLIRSIIATESGFNPEAVSSKGARGLMQLMPATAKQLGIENSFDPEQNIQGGVKHFRSLMDNFNQDVYLSLAAYNAGENLVQRLGRVPNIKETENYVKLVTDLYIESKSEEIEQEKKQQQEQAPTIYRYTDESGVLNLTNIAPPR